MSYNALEPRAETFEVLAQTRNSAAVPALAAGLNSSSKQVRSKCVRLLLDRDEIAARRAVIVEWTRLDSSSREQLANSKKEFEKACKEVLTNGSQAHKHAVITAISDLDLTAALPELIQLSLDTKNPVRDTAMGAVFELCDRWGQRARQGKDVPGVRGPMLDAMQRAICDYSMHRSFELIDAWLMLVCWDDATQRSLISDPMHPAFRPVLDRLWHSDHKSVLQLLGGYTWRTSTPKSVLSIICERSERELPVLIAESVDENTMSAVLRRLAELPQLASLSSLSTRPSDATPEVHRRLWLMLSANSPSIDAVVAGAVAFYKDGTAEGRRTAADIIRSCRRVEVETLIEFMHTAETEPSNTQCVGAHLNTILSWVGGTSTMLDTAAREFFSDFTVGLLMDVTRKWAAPLCRQLARVVSRTEPEAVSQLLKALDSPAPTRRLLALQVIQMLEVTSEINERLLPLIHDSRVEVRVRAIDLLSALDSPQLQELLPALLDDPTTDVQDAARRAQKPNSTTTPSPASSITFDASSPTLMTTKTPS